MRLLFGNVTLNALHNFHYYAAKQGRLLTKLFPSTRGLKSS